MVQRCNRLPGLDGAAPLGQPRSNTGNQALWCYTTKLTLHSRACADGQEATATHAQRTLVRLDRVTRVYSDGRERTVTHALWGGTGTCVTLAPVGGRERAVMSARPHSLDKTVTPALMDGRGITVTNVIGGGREKNAINVLLPLLDRIVMHVK